MKRTSHHGAPQAPSRSLLLLPRSLLPCLVILCTSAILYEASHLRSKIAGSGDDIRRGTFAIFLSHFIDASLAPNRRSMEHQLQHPLLLDFDENGERQHHVGDGDFDDDDERLHQQEEQDPAVHWRRTSGRRRRRRCCCGGVAGEGSARIQQHHRQQKQGEFGLFVRLAGPTVLIQLALNAVPSLMVASFVGRHKFEPDGDESSDSSHSGSGSNIYHLDGYALAQLTGKRPVITPR